MQDWFRQDGNPDLFSEEAKGILAFPLSSPLFVLVLFSSCVAMAGYCMKKRHSPQKEQNPCATANMEPMVLEPPAVCLVDP